MNENKLKTPDHRTSVFGLLLLMAVCGLALLCVSTVGLLHGPQKADHCDTNAEGHIIPSRTTDGRLEKVGDIYYSHQDGRDDVFVAACFPRKGGAECHGPVKFVEGHVNEPVHVEFCGKTVTRLTLSERDVLFSLPTQDEPDAINAKERRVDYVTLGIAVLVIVGSVIGFRAMRWKKQP